MAHGCVVWLHIVHCTCMYMYVHCTWCNVLIKRALILKRYIPEKFNFDAALLYIVSHGI
jgi:hypothetical protein